MKLAATHFDTACLLLEVGPFQLLTDPAFDPPGKTFNVLGLARYRRLSEPKVPTLPALDACLVSHDQHEDNLDAAGLELARRAPKLLTTKAGATRLGGNALGLAPWESMTLTNARGAALRITATPAQHAPKLLNPISGPVIGFVLESDAVEGAVWVSGDTVLFDGVREVAKRFDVRHAFLHLGCVGFLATGPATYTFSAREAVEVAKLMPKAEVVPLHYEGWTHFREGRSDVAQAFEAAGLAQRVRWLEPSVHTVLTR